MPVEILRVAKLLCAEWTSVLLVAVEVPDVRADIALPSKG